MDWKTEKSFEDGIKNMLGFMWEGIKFILRLMKEGLDFIYK